jgi:Subtilase family
LFASTYAVSSTEPLAPCQWDMSLIGATASGAWTGATGRGVSVGVLDSGVDITHPDIAPNLDLARSCSFIFGSTPTAAASEIANGECSNKAAVQDLFGHGTHVASEIEAPVNGIGIAGVAPQAKIVALHACTVAGFCCVDSVAAALRCAGDQRLTFTGVAALIKHRHPGWGPGALAAAVLRTATPLSCPPTWHPEFDGDTRACTGGSTNSFFGHGLVNAAAAAHS